MGGHGFLDGTHGQQPFQTFCLRSYHRIAFLTGNHGYDSDLCYLDIEGNLHTAAKGVADFAIGDFFLAYGDMDKVYVYFFSDGSTFCITRSGEKAQFLGAGGEHVWWMDVTWRDKDILEYMEIPHK